MNYFTLKDIKGAVVEKGKEEMPTDFPTSVENARIRTWNRAIDAQSSVKLRFNREKLKDMLCRANFNCDPEWLVFCKQKDDKHKGLEEILEALADAIIASGAELLEVVNEPKTDRV